MSSAAALDMKLWRMQEVCISSLTLWGDDNDCVEKGTVDSINVLSFQQLVVRLPIKMGRLGIRNQEQLRKEAFVGSIEQFVHQD